MYPPQDDEGSEVEQGERVAEKGSVKQGGDMVGG